jgi:hypothetical protein
MEALRTLEAWDASSREERQDVVEAILQLLGPVIRFVVWERHALGDQVHDTAVFARNARRYALLPGYVGELGCDPARHHLPERLTADWREYGHPDGSFADYLGRRLTSHRRVALAPFLVETTAAPLAPRKRHSWGVEVFDAPRQPDLLTKLIGQGYRYPTVDEWEYACSGGSRAFFRWGDTWPSNAWSPIDLRGVDDWRDDTRPNAFGLLIGQDSQALEFCMEPGEYRGGDGVAASQVDSSYLAWLGFATSYRPQLKHPDAWYDPYLRRVVPLDGLL